MKRILLSLLFIGWASSLLFSAQQSLIISEVADPSDDYTARFVELFNTGSVPIDLTAGNYMLVRQSNGGSYASIQLSGTIDAGGTYVIAYSETSFTNAYGISADLYSGNINGNGDDGYFLYIGGDQTTGTLLDAYGVPDQDGTGQPWEYTDGHAVRNSDIGQSNTVWTDSEWTITRPANVADMTPGQHTYSPAGTPPKWAAGYPAAIARDINAIVHVKIDEPGIAYAIAVAGGSPAPTSEQVKAGTDYGSVTVVSAGNVTIPDETQEYLINLENLTPVTGYEVWIVAEDDEATPNLQTEPVKLPVSTTEQRELSMTKPKSNDTVYVGGVLHYEWTSKNIDSLYLGVGSDGNFEPITGDDDETPIVVDASLGSFDFPIPEGAAEDAGNTFDLCLMDAADISYISNAATSVLLLDARKLEWIAPQDGQTYYVGDTVYFKWHAEYVDSIMIGGYDYSDSSWFMIPDDDNPMVFPANMDSLMFPIPLDASTDSVRLIIYDAADTSLNDVADPVYLIDTIQPEIALLMPDNGKQQVPYTFNALIAFTEEVTPVSGNIYLHKEDGTVIATYDITTLEHDWSAFLIKIDQPLDRGTSYYFTMDANAVKDNQGNLFGGFTDPNTWRFTTADKQLYISEYVEGSSNNKALEIFNPTDATIDLSQYAFMSSYNGNGWDYPPYVLHGTLAPGEVYTILNPSFDFSLLADSAAVVDTLIGQYLTWFNGDDARGLVQLIGGTWEELTNFAFIDVIGDPDNDPGSGWDVAGVTTATQNHTLIRKRSVQTGNIVRGWEASAGTDAASSEWIVMDQNFVDNLGSPTPDASDNTTIVAFELRDTTGNLVSTTVTIDSAAATITAEIIYSAGSMIDSLVPVITVADDGTSSPASGDTLDFTNPVVFTVTAEDGFATRNWTVTVTPATAPSTEAMITSFSIDGQTGDAVIDSDNHTVTVEMPYATDVTALTPVFEVSAGATADPASGTVLDFTNPVIIAVTAEDGATTVEWTVTVNVFVPPVVSIHDIQYTTDTSGDSPYLGQMVTTSGIITAVNIYQGSFKGYFLQAEAAAWNGIYVYDPVHDTLAIGDSVTITGTVDEYYGLTEIKSVRNVILVNRGNTLPGPVELTTGEASSEQWEGVFVTFHNATCLHNDLGYGEVSVDDGSDSLIVDDFLYQYNLDDFVPGNVYNLTGVMNYSYGAYKLNPRSADDISDVTGIRNTVPAGDVQVYPNPTTGNFTVTVEGMKGENLRITVLNSIGSVVLTREVPGNSFIHEQFDLTGNSRGIYFIRVDNGKEMTVKRIVIR